MSLLFPCKPAVLLKQHLGKARPRRSAMPFSIHWLLATAGSVCPAAWGEAASLRW